MLFLVVAQGTKIPSKEIDNVACIDADAINIIDHNGESANLCYPVDAEENSSMKKFPEFDVFHQSSSLVSRQDLQSTPNISEPELSGADTAAEAASLHNRKSDCAVSDISSAVIEFYIC